MKKFSSVFIGSEDKTEELNEFVKFIRLPEGILPRCSLIMILQMYKATIIERTMNPAKIIHEILGMEGVDQSITKAETKFKHYPLKGLWHKHYFADGINVMAINLRGALNTYGMPWLSQKVKDAQESGEERYITAEDVAKIADDVVRGNWERKVADKKITGEWIIYTKHEGKNFYLCLAKHDSGDMNIRKLIDDFCLLEFPFLNNLLCPHESST